MTLQFDCHSHSTFSDGTLAPTELVNRAKSRGVKYLALTDHDTTAGLQEARSTAENIGIQLIPGIEISTTWENQCFHIVGLGIDPNHPPLVKGIATLRDTRESRAREMGRRLEKKGIPGAYHAAAKLAGHGMITRTHFARFLLSQNHASNMQQVFDRYLTRGKPGFVSTCWAKLNDAVNWITGSGGVAVMAHPRRYKITATRMKKLLSAFAKAGGQGIEVVCGSSNIDDIQVTARLAIQFGLLGSAGSDFHSPDNCWIELGRLQPLPENITAVWERLGLDCEVPEIADPH